MQLFYTPDINVADSTIILNKEESTHIVRVLRMGEGEELLLTNGKGHLLHCRIEIANKKGCEVSVIDIQKDFEKKDYYIHIAVAPTKNNDRLEWFLEKATEIGIDEITPIIGDHSERKIIKKDRLIKVVTSAVKQSLKAYVPIVNDQIKLKEFLDKDFSEYDKYVAHLVDDDRKSLKSELKPKQKYLVLIGPEGDFSEKEVDLAIIKGFTPVTLGNFRLRTETAALAAVHSIAFFNE